MSELQIDTRESTRLRQAKWRSAHLDLARERSRIAAKAHYDRNKDIKYQKVKEKKYWAKFFEMFPVPI